VEVVATKIERVNTGALARGTLYFMLVQAVFILFMFYLQNKKYLNSFCK
jgi:hypothetical protein